MQLYNALLAWLSPFTCHMEQFVHSTACTVQMQADTSMSTQSCSQGEKWQLPCRAPGQFVCCGGRLTSAHHGRMQELVGERARRDNAQCPCVVPAGSSSCPSLLPICDNYSFNWLASVDKQVPSSRKSGCVHERKRREERAGCWGALYIHWSVTRLYPVLWTASDAAFLSTYSLLL